jgi:hypothetical protein
MCRSDHPPPAISDGSRTVRAGDFFTGPLSTLRQPDEIVTELHLPKWPSSRRWAFRKYARRDGDFALAGILLFYDEDRQGGLSNAHAGVIGACSRPEDLGGRRGIGCGVPFRDSPTGGCGTLPRQAERVYALSPRPPVENAGFRPQSASARRPTLTRRHAGHAAYWCPCSRFARVITGTPGATTRQLD